MPRSRLGFRPVLHKKTLNRKIKKIILEKYAASLQKTRDRSRDPSILMSNKDNNNLPVIENDLEQTVNESQSIEINHSPPQQQNNSISESDGASSVATDLEETNFCFNESWEDLLSAFAVKHQLTHLALNDLLKIMRKKGVKNLPLDARTLLKTNKRPVVVIEVAPGEYWHGGIEKGLNSLLKNNSNILNEITIDIGIDGIPISNSSKAQFWPILGRIKQHNSIFVIGIYCGPAKPNSAEEFLKMFIEEIIYLLNTGIKINNVNIKIHIGVFILDAPAKAFILGTKGHNAYFGCGKCYVEGDYFHIDHHMSFCDVNCKLRTDELFRSQDQEEHHITSSPLLQLPIDMVNAVPLDYLHLILLGVVKKLITFWTKSKRSKIFGNLAVKLRAFQINKISTRLLKTDRRRPIEFHRQVRSLDVFSFWKGTEFRTFLLYVGPIVLKDLVDEQIFQNFMALHCAITICLSEKHLKTLINVADALLIGFIDGFKQIYGLSNMSYNVHNLIHLISDVKRLGSLENFSAFPFESTLNKIIRLIRSGNKPLQQVANRIGEIIQQKSTENSKAALLSTQLSGKFKIRNDSDVLFSSIKTKNFTLKNNIRNKWFLSKNKEIIAMVYAKYNNDNEVVIAGKKIISKKDLYYLPLASSNLDIYRTPNKFQESTSLYGLSEIECKLFSFKIPNSTDFAFFPILHTF